MHYTTTIVYVIAFFYRQHTTLYDVSNVHSAFHFVDYENTRKVVGSYLVNVALCTLAKALLNHF